MEEAALNQDWTLPPIRYGDGMIREAMSIDVPYAAATMELPWSLARGHINTPPKSLVLAGSMELQNLEDLASSTPDVDLVAGIGGGSAHDLAKFIAMKQQCRLIQIPTMIGGDASVTPSVGIRSEGRVRYVGRVPCEAVFVDYSLLRQAPPDLVTIGACDCLSSETALWDWYLAVEAGQEKRDDAIRIQALQALETVKRNRLEIRDQTPLGIRSIFEGYQTYARLAQDLGSDRAQEGSEHFLAYYIEYLSKRSFVHGQLLAVCLAATAHLQQVPFDSVVSTLSEMEISIDPEAIGISPQLFIQALTGLQGFVSINGYYYSSAHARTVSESDARATLTALKKTS